MKGVSSLESLQNKLRSIDVPPLPLIVTAFVAIQFRALLEMFAYRADAFEPVFFLLHLPLFFFAIFLTTATCFSYLADYPIKQAIGLFLLLMPIIILVPIIDIVVYGLHSRGIHYVTIQKENVFLQFVNVVFCRGASDSISIGQYLLVHISGCVTAFLCWVYARSLFRSVLMWFLVLVMAFFYVTLESGFTNILLLIGSTIREHVGATPVSTQEPFLIIKSRKMFVVGVYLLLCLPLSFAMLLRFSKLRVLLRNSKPFRAFHYILMYVIGLLLHVKSHQSLGIILSSPYNLLAVILGGTAILSAFLSAVWFNDLFDLKIDRVSNPNRPLPSGQLSSHAVVIIAVSLFVYSILCAVPLGSHVVSLILCCNGIAFIYSSPPLRLRRYFPMSTMAIGLCSSMAMIVGFYLLNGNHVIIPSYEYFLIPLGIAFVSTFKDIKDVEGDSVDASYSLANILPPLYGRCATAVCVFIGINILFACFVERVLHPIGVVLGIVGAVLISTLPKPDKIPVAVYLVLMIMLLVYHML